MKQSCVSVVQQKKVLKKYGFNISVSEGKQTLKVPSDEKANPLWEDFVNARFLETAPHAAGVLDRLHPETIACINFEIAKVCVNADLSKQLPKRSTTQSMMKRSQLNSAILCYLLDVVAVGSGGIYKLIVVRRITEKRKNRSKSL